MIHIVWINDHYKQIYLSYHSFLQTLQHIRSCVYINSTILALDLLWTPVIPTAFDVECIYS